MKRWTRIAHRGAASQAPENTLASFRRALQIGTDAVEFDVHLSKDGEVVVMHDDTVDRTTDGMGRIADMTLEEILRIDVGVRFSEEFRGERIPTLRESLECIPPHTISIIEIKADAATVPTLDTVQEVDRTDSSLVVSFSPAILRTVASYRPEMARAMSIGEPLVEGDPVANARRMLCAALSTGTSTLDVRGDLLTPEAVAEVQHRGGSLWVWTLDEPEHIRMAVDWGVDGITSNFPDRLNAAR